MLSEVAVLLELFGALSAVIRSLACVCSHVSFQQLSCPKHFVAGFTLVYLLSEMTWNGKIYECKFVGIVRSMI